MSTYWGYQCKEHSDACVLPVRTAYIEELKQLLGYWATIEGILALETSSVTIDVRFDPATVCGEGSDQIWEFLQEHFGHGLLLCNEYGHTEEL